ncbi:MAG: SDR family oxidoreductase [Flavobacteriales bacterium]|nr:SDR family oxidoreductase [Flavobacteriales bacterium]MCB9204365.1 SDR family oxidoreductase [Flavobacteriales bacterium]
MKEKILGLLGFPPPTALVKTYSPWKEGTTITENALVVDGRSVKDEVGLKAVFNQLQGGVKNIKVNGKVLVYSIQPELIEDTHYSAYQRSLEGIARSLAKELGGRGTTVNLLKLPPNADLKNYTVPEQFFTSGRSAFITGQAVVLDGEAPKVGDLSDKVCVVTGGAGGIGSATVKRLAAEGATVIIADIPQMEERAKSLLNDTSTSLSASKVSFMGADLTKPEARKQLLEAIKAKHGRIDVLINNAGITRDKTLKNMPEHYWDQVIDINLSAVIALTEDALELGLIPHGGRIISTSSISGIAGNFGQTNYTATKAAVIGYSASKAKELKAKGITINAIAPGYIETEMVKTMPLITRIFAERLTSLAQAGKPEDIAEAMAFLAHPGAECINGQVLRVCGGSFLGA